MNRIAVRSSDRRISAMELGVGDKPRKESTSNSDRFDVVAAVILDVTTRATIVTTVTARIRTRITEGESRGRFGCGRERGLR